MIDFTNIFIEKYSVLFEKLGIDSEDFIENEECIRGPCPIHRGDNKTAFVFYFNGIWMCWSNHCHEKYSHGVIGLVMAITEKDYKESLELCKKILCSEIPLELYCRRKKEIVKKDVLEEHINQHSFDESLLSNIKRDYHFLKSREIDTKIAKRYNIGRINYCGIYDRIAFPIRNIESKIVGITCRKVLKRDNGPKWLHWPFPNSKKFGINNKFKKSINLFNIDEAIKHLKNRDNKKVIITEGPIDTLKLVAAGFPNSISILGSIISNEQVELLSRLGINKVILALDNDNSGNTGAEKAYMKLSKKMIDVEIITTPESKDCGDLDMKQIKKIMKTRKSYE